MNNQTEFLFLIKEFDLSSPFRGQGVLSPTLLLISGLLDLPINFQNIHRL